MAYMKITPAEAAEVRALCRRMFFSRETVDAFLGEATAGQVRALARMVRSELELRESRKVQRLVRRARFPARKTLDGYDFSQVSMPEGYTVDDLRSLAFLDAAEGFVFHGQTGRGKTHLAIALGTLAIQERGLEVRFFTAAELVLALERANREQRLDTFMRELSRCSMLVLDELGYVPLSREGARLLFQVISDCYEARSLVITTNIEFSKWGTVFGDEKMAAAVLDRVVHHSRLLEFNGPSRRMEEALMLGKSK